MRGYPQFSFWISITIVKICISRIFSKPGKNTFELVGTVLNSQRYSCSGGKRLGKYFLSAFFAGLNPVWHIIIAVVHTGGHDSRQASEGYKLKVIVYF